MFLSDTDGELSGIRVITQLETWLSLTAYDQPWQEWVQERLDDLAADAAASGRGVPGPDLELAVEAWRWLRETELLAPDLNAVPGGAAAGRRGRGTEGVDAGVAARTAARAPRHPPLLGAVPASSRGRAGLFGGPRKIGPIRGPEASECLGHDSVRR